MQKRFVLLVVLLTLGLLPSLTTLSAAPAPANTAAPVLEQKININTADARQLSLLPGIGPKTAEKIVAYRDEHGSFKKVEDLLEIRGIGMKSLAKMKEYITL